MAIDLLVNVNLAMREESIAFMAEKYAVHHVPNNRDNPALVDAAVLARVRAVFTNGSFGIKRALIEAMPQLEIIAAIGAGVENVDLAAARERDVVVTYGPGANASSVADHAWALILGAMRRVPWCDKGVREGRWREVRQPAPTVAGKRLGIFGLGHVGMEIARRGAGGFAMEVGYRSRRRRDEVPYRYFDSLKELAAWSDVLVLAAPGGADTHHIVDADILDALGPQGFLVNIGRGSLLDTGALIAALAQGRIAGAGIDVIEGEPTVPEGFVGLERLVLSPHLGATSPEANQAMLQLLRDNLDAHFAGRPVLTPVPL